MASDFSKDLHLYVEQKEIQRYMNHGIARVMIGSLDKNGSDRPYRIPLEELSEIVEPRFCWKPSGGHHSPSRIVIASERARKSVPVSATDIPSGADMLYVKVENAYFPEQGLVKKIATEPVSD